MEIITEENEDFVITTDKTKLDIDVIYDFLTNQSFWARNITFEKVKTSIENSLNFGLFFHDKQIGYARVISDFSTIAYLGDVFIIEEYRGRGLSKWLLEKVMNHPNLQGLRRWILLTADAHELYKKYGWTAITSPDKWMEKYDSAVYEKQ